MSSDITVQKFIDSFSLMTKLATDHVSKNTHGLLDDSSSNSIPQKSHVVYYDFASDAEAYFAERMKKQILGMNFKGYTKFSDFREYYQNKKRKLKGRLKRDLMRTRLLWQMTDLENKTEANQIRMFVLDQLYEMQVTRVSDMVKEFIFWNPDYNDRKAAKYIRQTLDLLTYRNIIKLMQIDKTDKHWTKGWKCKVYMLAEAGQKEFERAKRGYLDFKHGYLEFDQSEDKFVEEKNKMRLINAKSENQSLKDKEYSEILTENKKLKEKLKEQAKKAIKNEQKESTGHTATFDFEKEQKNQEEKTQSLITEIITTKCVYNNSQCSFELNNLCQTCERKICTNHVSIHKQCFPKKNKIKTYAKDHRGNKQVGRKRTESIIIQL